MITVYRLVNSTSKAASASYIAACFASPAAWVCADLFLIPACVGCIARLRKRSSGPQRRRQDHPYQDARNPSLPHLRADGLDVGDDVGGEDDHPVLGKGADQVPKPHPLNLEDLFLYYFGGNEG